MWNIPAATMMDAYPVSEAIKAVFGAAGREFWNGVARDEDEADVLARMSEAERRMSEQVAASRKAMGMPNG